ncbi:MAG: molybdopterin-dependent oxidoreductase [Bacteroidetes bacterium]|nr:molybdopterin-dependent oxidoreductase [Bacteroidota bacterium]
MKNIETFTHVRGESIYLDDIPELSGTLYGAAFGSPHAHGKIRKLDLSEALDYPGVVRIFTYDDIPGKNQIGSIVADEELFAEDEVHFRGMPVAFVVAESDEAARAAVKKIKIEIDPLEVITDPRVAKEMGNLLTPSRTFNLGDCESAWDKCAHIFQGIAETNGQEHLYIETQGAYTLPLDHDSIKVFTSTQGPTAVQSHMADVLGIPMHRLEVEVTRLGGGFGGKEDQATTWAILCALATYHLRKPVKYSLHRLDDMWMTGKRNPYSSDFKIGLDQDLKIIAYQATFYQNAGASADLSPSVLERTLFHCTNTYFIPNVKAVSYCCRTNLPPNTAFRGFGGPQGMFVIEAAINTAAEYLGVSALEIQRKNLLKTGDELPFGQKVKSYANECWQQAEKLFDISQMQRDISHFNKENNLFKKGLAIMPICFGISFTKITLNQARALVHVYIDGSVGVSTGAVEMGQGVNTKMAQVASSIFSIDPARVKIHSTNTYRISNTSPSAASATADLNGKAVEMACNEILGRLKFVASEMLHCTELDITFSNEIIFCKEKQTELTWTQLIQAAYTRRTALSEHAHYATPEIHYNPTIEKGHPFAYHVYGTSVCVVKVDCVRGTYEVEEIKVVHDFGKPINDLIDYGQIEGGIVQGMGWMTMEEIIYDQNGVLRSNALSTYKVPDIYSVPKTLEVHPFLSDEPMAIFGSKATGEPPLMYGLGVYFAIRNAVCAFNNNCSPAYSAPFTPEKVLMNLYAPIKKSSEKNEPTITGLETNQTQP